MNMLQDDRLTIGGHSFTSRFILGSGKYSLELIQAAIEKAGAQMVTLALRRANEGGLANILDYIPKSVTLLPNTSGARNADEAIQLPGWPASWVAGILSRSRSFMTQNTFCRTTTKPSRQTEVLAKEGFVVMPYMYP